MTLDNENNYEIVQFLGLLNVFLYMDSDAHIPVGDGENFATAVSKYIPPDDFSENNHLRLRILKKGVRSNRLFINLKVTNYVDRDFSAALFYNEKTFFVGFRGSKLDEWYGNVDALAGVEAHTKQQKEALDYFNQIAEHTLSNSDKSVIVFGHSNGGLKAQYVLFNSIYQNLIDKVYAFCSQRFSPESLICYFKDHDERSLEDCAEKILLVETYGDLVHRMGYVNEDSYFIKNGHEICIDSSFKGAFRPHFAESIFTEDAELNKLVSCDCASKIENTTIRFSHWYMNRKPASRKRIGDVIIGVFLLSRSTKIDKLVDWIAKRRNKNFKNF